MGPRTDPSSQTAASSRGRRIAWWAAATGFLGFLVYLMATAKTGPVDPTDVRGPQSEATVVTNSALIVFREGLEAVLIFAAVTASFVGANRRRRRPVVAGAAVAFATAVAT
jgi:high-affinity iron transporter